MLGDRQLRRRPGPAWLPQIPQDLGSAGPQDRRTQPGPITFMLRGPQLNAYSSHEHGNKRVHTHAYIRWLDWNYVSQNQIYEILVETISNRLSRLFLFGFAGETRWNILEYITNISSLRICCQLNYCNLSIIFKAFLFITLYYLHDSIYVYSPLLGFYWEYVPIAPSHTFSSCYRPVVSCTGHLPDVFLYELCLTRSVSFFPGTSRVMTETRKPRKKG